jgi:hypothetical protein
MITIDTINMAINVPFIKILLFNYVMFIIHVEFLSIDFALFMQS